MAQKVKFITSTNQVIDGSEDFIIFNSAAAINFNLGPALGDGRLFRMKNIGAGAVTLVVSGFDTIFEGSEVTSKILACGESTELVDSKDEQWTASYVDFETVPLAEGGTGIVSSGVTNIFYVDGNRTDSYTADGSILRPYLTIDAALTVINAAALAHQTASTYAQANYVVEVASGTYDEALTIGNVKNLRFNLHGVTISGNITYTTTMVGGTADNYYSRLEFAGATGNRPEKGTAGRITGTFTGTRNNDSLTYVSFAGIDIAGNMAFNTNGTWVVQMHSCMLSARFSCGNAAIALLETTGHTIITGAIAAAADGTSVTAVSLYNCQNTEFALINISNAAGSRVTNCTFKAATATTFTGGTLAIDANSYKTLLAATETLAGCTLSHLDNIGENPTPCGARTAGAIVATATVNTNIDALDAAIGFEAQMSATPNVVVKTGTVFQALDKLDTYKSVQTVKKTIGGVGVAACDFNFATAGDTAEQVIDLGAIVPARARVIDVYLITDTIFTGATSLVADVGNASGGAQFIASATIYAANAVLAQAVGGAFTVAPAVAASNVFVNATPGANWSNVTAGKVSCYVTFINPTNI